MKAVVLYETANVTMEKIMEVYPRHKTLCDQFAKDGKVIGIGPFVPPGGSMGIFRDKASAEEFVSKDPFVLEKLVGKITIREWNDTLLK